MHATTPPALWPSSSDTEWTSSNRCAHLGAKAADPRGIADSVAVGQHMAWPEVEIAMATHGAPQSPFCAPGLFLGADLR
jgi:hypothetical protein